MKQKLDYEPPGVKTISSRELLAAMGPAQANPSGSSGGSVGINDVTGMTGGNLGAK